MYNIKFFWLILLLFLLTPKNVLATIGVGIGTGKIQIDEKLKPGIIYELPPLTVINTGDEESDYEINVSYHENQEQEKPLQNWFIFSPAKFNLEPKQVQLVKNKLNLPLKLRPGQYFAYLEARPLKRDTTANSVIGIAAATKLYFEVVPANLISSIYYKVEAFWKIYQPWTSRVALILGLIVLILILRRFIKIEINFKKPNKTDKS